MRESALYSQFETAFKNAKYLIRQNDPIAARAYLINCMAIMAELYKSTGSALERAQLYSHICEFKQISASLYQEGITADVKSWFGISENGIQKRREKELPSEIDKIIEDDSVGWAANVFKKYSGSVVIISATMPEDQVTSFGTGFILSEKGYLLTNDHVVYGSRRRRAQEIRMRFQGSQNTVPVEFVASDSKYDVALCRFDVTQTGPVTPVKRIEDYAKLMPGEPIVVIGNGLSMGLAPFTGDVKFTHDDRCRNLVTNAQSNHGDSGGPVFNRKGECVGINKSIVSRYSNVAVQGITYATPMDTINELLAKWCEKYDIEL